MGCCNSKENDEERQRLIHNERRRIAEQQSNIQSQRNSNNNGKVDVFGSSSNIPSANNPSNTQPTPKQNRQIDEQKKIKTNHCQS
mmetsp:Transcript_9300/g.15844  ORF Transcript_9300/g.15844 Transcript_9300/m.15844 type:complete len:85 (-) Transcript_9300:129-383(-)